MSSLSYKEAILIATVVGSVMWTLHTVAFVFALRYSVWDSQRILRRNNINWLILTSCCVIWVLASFNFLINAVVRIRGFASSEGPRAIQDWKAHMTTTVQLIIVTLGDFVMIYRCWILYSRSWMIVLLPSIIQLGELSCGLTLVVMIWKDLRDGALTYHGVAVTIKAVTLGTWACSCALTLLTTFLICLRIWSVERTIKRTLSHGSLQARDSLMYIVRIIAESGLLYALALLVTLIVFVAGSTEAYILTAIDFQLAGIAYDLIIIRSATHVEREYTLSTANVMPSFASLWQDRSNDTGTTGIEARDTST